MDVARPITDEPASGARGGIRLGTVLGAPVLLMPSWFVIAILITATYTPAVRTRLPDAGAMAILVAFGAAALLLASVFLHELAHAVAARAVGTPPSHIVLDLWGGHTAFDADLTTPGRSALVSVVGPGTNAVLAVVGLVLQPLVADDGVADLLLIGLIYSNAVVAIFNALPGLPLDGGRVLEALVWKVSGNRGLGTVSAGWAGRLVAAGLAFWAVGRPLLAGRVPSLTSAIWMLLIAWMLWQGATSALTIGRWRQRTPTLSVRELIRPAVAVAAASPLAEALHHAQISRAEQIVLLGHDGEPIAVVDARALASVPPERLSVTPAQAVGRSLPPHATVPITLDGEALLEHLRATAHHEYAVLDPAGRVVGVLYGTDIQARLDGRASG